MSFEIAEHQFTPLHYRLHQTFETCLGPANVAACIEPQYLIHSEGYSARQAYEFVEINAGYDFKCNKTNEKGFFDSSVKPE